MEMNGSSRFRRLAGGRGGRVSVAPVVLLFALLAARPGPAPAVINPRFTPADLVRTSSQMLLLKVASPRDKSLSAEVVEALKGQAPGEKSLRLELHGDSDLTEEEVAAAFGGGKTATAVLVLMRPEDKEADDSPAGALLIDTQWFAVARMEDKWVLDRDKRDLLAVWAGSARMLAAATRYVLADPLASFPVRSEITWGSDLHLGKVSGRVWGCVVVDFGPPLGLCAIVLSDGGDRLYQAASKGGQPADVTGKVNPGTASRLAAPGDFDGDGRMDLACWDGEALKLATQTREGTFSVRALTAKLPDCVSLHAVDVGGKAGLLAGSSGGPVVLVPDDPSTYPPPRAQAAGKEPTADMGPGGLCIPADFDGDGRCDIMQLFTKGMAYYGGEGAGKLKAPVRTALALPKNPRVAVCGDYDADQRLDLIVAGEDGLALVSRNQDGAWEAHTHITGELAYHGNANQPCIVGGAPADINNDGRQGVALFYPKSNLMVFFNRGFACFGLARELDLSGSSVPVSDVIDPFAQPETRLKAAEALQHGQAAGAVWDLNGDGFQDLLAADAQGDVWVLFGQGGDHPPLGVTVRLPARSPAPATVGVYEQGRCVGMHVVRAGVPAFVGCQRPGPLTLRWADPDGKTRTRTVVVESPTRVELSEQ